MSNRARWLFDQTPFSPRIAGASDPERVGATPSLQRERETIV